MINLPYFAAVPPATAYLPSIFSPVPAYQKWLPFDPIPADASDVHRRSAAGLYALNHLEELTTRMLPQGFRMGSLYQGGNISVALDFSSHLQSGLLLTPGMWVDERGYFGADLIELYAHIHGTSYGKAASAIFDAYGRRCDDGHDQIEKPARWRQDTHPMHDQSAEWPSPGIPHHSDVRIFRNAAGQRIAILARIRTTSGQIAHVYHTLWRRNGRYRSVWAAIFPSEAFFLHADIMKQFPDSPVHVLLDPFVAKSNMGLGETWISTVLPSGSSSIPDADLTLLRGRDIRIDLDPAGVENLLKIDRALKTVGVRSSAYSLPGQKGYFLGIDEAATKAESVGFTLKGRKASDTSDAVVIAEPGQPIPGSEIQRDMLLHPFLKEGYLAWLYAPEKTGKSWVASAIAQAIASGKGTIGNWIPSKKAGVLLVDGEMLPDELDETIRLVSAGLNSEYSTPRFQVLCAKSQPSGLIDIEEEAWQHRIEKLLVGKSLLVLDNLQSLMANGGARLDPVQAWLYRITQKGIAVLVLDHSNADGELQGSIAKRRIANIVISMRCENDEAKTNGIATVAYTSSRRLYGPDATSFLLRRVHEEGAVRFEALMKEAREPAEIRVPERIRKMALVAFARNNGKTFREICNENGNHIPLATASDLMKAAAALGGEDLRQFEAEIARLEAEKRENQED